MSKQIVLVTVAFHFFLLAFRFFLFTLFFSLISSLLRYHNSTIINADFTRGGINLENEKTSEGTTSRLLLTRASLKDSGNYTCVPASQAFESAPMPTLTALPASVAVQVVNP